MDFVSGHVKRAIPASGRNLACPDAILAGRAKVARFLGRELPDFRAMDRLLRRVLPLDRGPGFDFQVPYFSGCYLGDTNDFIDWCAWVYGGYEVATVNLLREIATDVAGAMFVDVGAHSGTFTLALRDLVDHVLAVEPAAINRSRLGRNPAANNASNVTVLPVAIAERIGSAELHFPEAHRNSGVASLDPAYNSANRRRETVGLETMDALLADVALDRPLIVKVDVEGTARRVLAGFQSMLSRPCLLVIETASSELLDEIQSGGFEDRSLWPWYRQIKMSRFSSDAGMHMLTNSETWLPSCRRVWWYLKPQPEIR